MGFLNDIYGARGRYLREQEEASGKPRAPYFMSDKSAYKSPIDRTVVEGRTAHKEHMRKHGVIEAGDMPFGSAVRDTEPRGVRQDIQRTIQELSSR